jgi:hypothetical protein
LINSRQRRGVVSGMAVLSLAAGPALAQDLGPANWRAEKCARYGKVTAEALARLTTRGMSEAFLQGHAAFIASECTAPAKVCPRSEAELRFANILVLAGMNSGLSSTFMPFGCNG